jgi:hypothetical protein
MADYQLTTLGDTVLRSIDGAYIPGDRAPPTMPRTSPGGPRATRPIPRPPRHARHRSTRAISCCGSRRPNRALFNNWRSPMDRSLSASPWVSPVATSISPARYWASDRRAHCRRRNRTGPQGRDTDPLTEASPDAWAAISTATAAFDHLNRLTNAEIEALNTAALGSR